MSLDAKLKDLEQQYKNLSVAQQQSETAGGRLLIQIRETKDTIKRTADSVAKGDEAFESLNKTTEKATSILQKIGNVAVHAGGAIGGVADAAYSGAGAFGDLNKSIDSTINLTKTGASLLDEFIPTSLINKIPLIGSGFNKTLEVVGKVGGAALEVTQDVIGLFNKVTGAVDKTTKAHRGQVKSIFDIGKMYGDSIGNAEKFTSSMRNAVSSDFGEKVNLTMGAMNSFMGSAANTSLNLKDMSQSVSVAGEETTALAAATAQYKALNIHSYVDNLNDMVKGQGLTMQESVKTFAMFGETAKNTGLNINKVSRTLMSTANNFQKLGMSAEFGRPLLEGFTDSLGDMGLGVENALSLTSSLSSALGKLTEDYGLAYLTFQRGGLEIGGATGGGGMLNTSIQLQAEMLEAEKTGDQSKIASQMVRGMKDTIASFTGGDIVTVKEAAEDSSLQNAFYMQQQMLSSQYGISGTDATRTLEMLSKLDEANARGDTETAKSLEKQIQEQKKADDKTLSLQEKMGIGISQAAASLEEQSIMMKMQVRGIYDKGVAEKVIKAIETGGKAAEEAINSKDKESIMAKSRGSIKKLYDEVNNINKDSSKTAAASAKKGADAKDDAEVNRLLGKGGKGAGKGRAEKGGDLKTALDKLVAYLEKPQKLTISFSDNAKDILQIAKDAKAAKGGR